MKQNINIGTYIVFIRVANNQILNMPKHKKLNFRQNV